MEGIPRGTVTFLFTDVEGSTRLWERQPDAMGLALAAHDRLLRSVIEAHRGHVFSTAGDAFSAAFWTPGEAVEAAVEAQRRLGAEASPGVVLRVRMGVHTGTAEERDGDYFGPALNRAARLMSAAHGGQVVMSLATAELIRDRLPADVGLVDIGDHEFPGLFRSEHVLQVVGPGLAREFPPLRSGGASVGNLRAAASRFVGHGAELEALVAELTVRRLVTLTGVGGVGKTRLAVEAARRAAAEFPEGVWLCELAAVAEPDSVAHAVGTTLSTRPQEGLSMVDSVVDALRDRRVLVILDNCEHVLDAVALLAGRIAESCPKVTLLATSREPIGVAGERVRAVPSLDPAAEGIELFCDRAAAADAAFSPTPDDLGVIGGICGRLDGIPLAIELAAARVRSMTPADLADRLHDRFGLLRRGYRGGVARHQTLRATVQWSYHLLAPAERVLFDRLAVFAGGFDLDAVEAVCGDDQVDRSEAGDLLTALVDKSMVVADRRGAHARYRLLETLREYGEERLSEVGDPAMLRDRHLRHFARIAAHARRQLVGTGCAEGLRLCETEWDNFRAAVQWAVISGDAAGATGLVETLHRFAVVRLRFELGDWAERVLELDRPGPGAYGVAAEFAGQGGDHEQALRLAAAGLAQAAPPSSLGRRLCVEASARAHWYSGHVTQAWAAVRTEESMCDPTEEPFDAAWAALRAAAFAQVVDPPSMAAHADRGRRLAAALHNPVLDTHVLWVTGMVERTAGHYDAAHADFQRALELAGRTGSPHFEGVATLSIGLLAIMRGADDAPRALRDALARLHTNREWMNVWPVVEATSLYWARTGQHEQAATLHGYLEANDVHHAMFATRRQEVLAAVHDAPDTEAWIARGGGMDRDQLVAYALSQLIAPGTTASL